jgi:hypothetical protein
MVSALAALLVASCLLGASLALPTVAQETAVIAVVNSLIDGWGLPAATDAADAGNQFAPFVRFAFHSCVGGCNGCLNLGLSDNNGLLKVPCRNKLCLT